VFVRSADSRTVPGVAIISEEACTTPALAMATSIEPCAFFTERIHERTLLSSATSRQVCSYRASANVAAPRLHPATDQPRETKYSAIPRPIPARVPLMTIVRPSIGTLAAADQLGHIPGEHIRGKT
jgi:hypothetical protein